MGVRGRLPLAQTSGDHKACRGPGCSWVEPSRFGAGVTPGRSLQGWGSGERRTPALRVSQAQRPPAQLPVSC